MKTKINIVQVVIDFECDNLVLSQCILVHLYVAYSNPIIFTKLRILDKWTQCTETLHLPCVILNYTDHIISTDFNHNIIIISPSEKIIKFTNKGPTTFLI